MRKQSFDFDDLLEQMTLLGRIRTPRPPAWIFAPAPLGTFTYGQVPKQLDFPEMRAIRAIVQSMTAQERSLDTALSLSRIERIAQGSGTTPSQVAALEKQLASMHPVMTGIAKLNKPRGFRA